MKKTLFRGAVSLLLVLAFVLTFSCSKTGSGSGSSGAVAKAEAVMQEEMRQTAPDFRYPYIEITDLEVPGMPEQLTWITAEGKNLGSKDAKVGGVLHRNIGEYPLTYRTTGPEGNGSMRSAFWTTLSMVWWVSETQTALPASATHWAYDKDMRGVYFKLNENIYWSDGVKCTAKDWVFNWESMINPNLNDPWYNNFYSQYEVKALTDYLVYIRITDDSLQVAPEELLDYCDFRPKPSHFYNGPLYEGWYEDYNWRAEPQTGPYVLDEENTIMGDVVAFKRVDNWWAREYPHFAGIGNIERVEYKVITGGAEIIENHFYEGNLDTFAVAIPDSIRKSETKEYVQKGYIDRYYLNIVPLQGQGSTIFFNTNFSLFKDRRVRHAMYYALDIQGMIDQVLYGEYNRYHNIGIGQEYFGVNFNDDTIRKPDFDPQKAMELLGEAGYTILGNDGILQNAAGERVSFELMYTARNHTERWTILVEQAKKAGVEIKLLLMESGASSLFRKKQYEAFFGGFNAGSVPSPWQFYSSANTVDKVEQSNNVTNYSSQEMDELLAAFDASTTLQEKADINKKIEQLVHYEALQVPVYYVGYEFLLAWKWVRYPAWGTDKKASDWNDPFWSYMWIDENIQSEVLDAMNTGKTYEPKYYRLTERYKAK